MISGQMSGGTADLRRTRPTDRSEGEIMEPQLMEWGPAHLRDEASAADPETYDRPDDN